MLPALAIVCVLSIVGSTVFVIYLKKTQYQFTVALWGDKKED